MNKNKNQLNSKFLFKIVSCSGEQPQYPASQLLSNSPKSKGWQTPRYCTYPQSLIIQLPEIKRINQIQILSHQSKISSKIQIHTSNSNKTYAKLGYLTLDNNQSTQFEVRQLKNIHVNIQCKYIKLVVHKNHINKLNLFNQVGIIAIALFGSGERLPQSAGIDLQLKLDKSTFDKIKQLEERKKAAIQMEDFGQAKRLKIQIQRLKQLGTELLELQNRKKLAIHRQDYDSAKIINDRIKMLRDGYNPQTKNQEPKPRQIPPQLQMFNKPQVVNYKEPINQNIQMFNKPQIVNYKEPINQNISLNRQTYRNDPFNQQLRIQNKDQVLIQKSKGESIKSQWKKERPISIPTRNQFMDDQRPIRNAPNQMYNFSKQNIKQPKNFQMSLDNGDPQHMPQPMNNEQRKFAQKYFKEIEEIIWDKIHSKVWSLREQGIRNLIPITPGTNLQSILAVIKQTITDKVANVFYASCQLLQMALLHFKPKSTANSQLINYTQDIINGLCQRTGQTNSRIKQQLVVMFQELPKWSLFNKSVCLKGLTKMGKNKLSPKAIIGRCQLINNIIKEYEMGKDFQMLMNFLIMHAEHASVDVRNAVMNTLHSIYLEVGKQQIMPYINKIRQPIRQTISNALESKEQGQVKTKKTKQNKSKSKQKPLKQKQSILKQKESTKVVVQKNKQNNNDPKNQNPQFYCEFCQVYNSQFTNQDVKDLHYFKQCVAMTMCHQCSQTVLIQSFTSHLLSQCQNSKFYKRCPRCKEAIHQRVYKSHTEQKACLPAKAPSAGNRCPLCHNDIGPSSQGWREHLVQNGCPNNFK